MRAPGGAPSDDDTQPAICFKVAAVWDRSLAVLIDGAFSAAVSIPVAMSGSLALYLYFEAFPPAVALEGIFVDLAAIENMEAVKNIGGYFGQASLVASFIVRDSLFGREKVDRRVAPAPVLPPTDHGWRRVLRPLVNGWRRARGSEGYGAYRSLGKRLRGVHVLQFDSAHARASEAKELTHFTMPSAEENAGRAYSFAARSAALLRNAPNALLFTPLAMVSMPVDAGMVVMQGQRRCLGDYLAGTVAVKEIPPFYPSK